MIYYICLYCIQIASVYSHTVLGCLDTALSELCCTHCVQLDYCSRSSTQDCLVLLVQSDLGKSHYKYSFNKTVL